MLTTLKTHTQFPRPQNLRLEMNGTSHRLPSKLTATEDHFRDRIDVSFEVGSQRPGQERSVKIQEAPASSKPGFLALRGVVRDQTRAFGMAAYVSEPDETGARSYKGQVGRENFSLRETQYPGGYHRVEGNVGSKRVEISYRTQGNQLQVDGDVGRHSLSLSGYESSGVESIPMAGIVTSLALSSVFERV